MDWTALGLSLQLAALTTLILCCAGLPLAYWLAVTKWRWKFLLEAVVALPLVLPPTVLGFYILIAIGKHSPLGRGYSALTGGQLPFSFPGLLLASILYSLPFAVRPFITGFAGILVPRRFPLGDLLPRHRAAFLDGHPQRGRYEFRAHGWRIWGGFDGGRKHPRRDAHGLDLHL